ncbi:thiol-disulfide oxidoreductase DCC family protein [Dokdonia sp. R86516]|uniref:thiol-disulfide oxidoreductase DCC family protein n=1 Tax=Dokdonia sp. R86516 TaxID=3093856 RepID=UPI0037CBCBA7
MTKKIILFDGVCNLCNGAITFIIQRDKKDLFRYAPLQSEIGKELAAKHHIDLDKVDSIILVTEDKAYAKSTAALHIAKQLSAGWPLLAVFLILPKFFRDAVYDFIARNRYKWFGKKEACMIPTPELKSKFLDTTPM